ncbi:MAG: hypothetical protein KDB01_14665 [Planctomycetaceae bacterium]|nr:hypothetical protein [Planctomycetaceae bacterium]
MSQHQKRIYGGLCIFLAATHVGCAGSGLKNMFTRNGIDGYHSLDELEAAESESEEQKPSVATRLASWRPFGAAESDNAETYADADPRTGTAEADSANSESTDSGRSRRFPALAFSKRDNVTPDPFLGAEPDHSDRADTPASPAAAEQKMAKADSKRSPASNELGTERDIASRSGTATDKIAAQVPPGKKSDAADAVALHDVRKSDAEDSTTSAEDSSLSKRFEQHFLLNSVGTVANSDAGKVATTKLESKKRNVAEIADRQIDEFHHLLASDPTPNAEHSGGDRKVKTAAPAAAKLHNAAPEDSADSLFAFDQLIGHEGDESTHKATQVAHTTVQVTKDVSSSRDVDVADAEALFGAAAARQNSRAKQAAEATRPGAVAGSATRSNAWSQAAENADGFQWNDSPSVTTALALDENSEDATDAFTRHIRSNTSAAPHQADNAGFAARSASADHVPGKSAFAVQTANVRLRNASASRNDHQVVTADYGTSSPAGVVQPATSEFSAAENASLITAPTAPVDDMDSSADVGSHAVRPGLVQSFSTRNWMLLIGGIIVIALLFAPGRTKPVTMNN